MHWESVQLAVTDRGVIFEGIRKQYSLIKEKVSNITLFRKKILFLSTDHFGTNFYKPV